MSMSKSNRSKDLPRRVQVKNVLYSGQPGLVHKSGFVMLNV